MSRSYNDEAENPAYPVETGTHRFTGLTKRELIAAMALSGYLANPDRCASHDDDALDAVASADALLAALEEQEGGGA